MTKVWWYYRPEDAGCGRKSFHGTQELFKSDHIDYIPVESVESLCTVHTLKEYQACESIDPSKDFYARFVYHSKEDRLSPDQVRVYCKCSMPVNPDFLMIQCDSCREWFHPACIGMSEGSVKRYTIWHCENCKEET